MMMKRAELFGKRNHVLCQKQAWLNITVQKFHDFSTTQILHQINFGDCGSAQSAKLTHLEAPNFDFMNFCTFKRLKIIKVTQFRGHKMVKMAALELLNSSKLISREIRMTENL